jgi:two-component system cell cycle sensor histidine kinase/response regulator CckA
MSDRATTPSVRAPVIDRTERLTGIGRLIVLAFALVGVSVGFAFVDPERSEPIVIGLLAILSVIGVVALLAGTIGLLRFAGRGQEESIGKAFVDVMGEGVLLTDRTGRIVYANRAYGELTGAVAERDVPSVDRAFSGNPEATEAIYRIAQKIRDGLPAEEEVRIPAPLNAPAGTEADARWYRISGRPLSPAGRRRALVAWRVSDISRERARQESIFQELQYAIDYLDHAPAGFLSAEPDGRIVYLNATLAEWLGIDLARFEPGSLTLSDIVRGDAIALLLAPADEETRNRTTVIDLDLTRQNGQSLPVRLLHRVPVTADGAPGATRTLVLNRSPGEESSEALRAAEVRFARFFNNTPIAIAAVDGQGRIGRTNASFLRLFGTTIMGGGTRRLVDLVGEGDRPKVEAALKSAGEGQGVVQIDAALAADGDRSARFYINPVAEGSGGVEAVIVNAIDITEQRALENQVRQQQKMDSVGQLAGGIAHDFNNVLTAIIGFSDLLLANHRPSDPSFQDIMNIKQNANRAAGLVRQLLAFSRRQTLRPQVLVLRDTLSDLSILLERLLGENVKLQLVHDRELWPIKFDLNQFEQVIINLAVNGRDAMPKGGTMTIRTRNLPAAESQSFGYKPLPKSDYVLIEVEDTGTGMTPEVQAKIFEPFFSTKEVGKGTGLGLSTVYGIVKQTGAHIFFTSIFGKGTVFRIFVPRHIPAAGEATPGQTETTAEIADLTGTATILLVEDEEAVRAFAARALQSRGYKVHEATSGIDALEVMKESGGAVDLVVSDVVMPELDGPSMLRELRKTRPDLKIIFISGYAEDAFRKNLPEGEKFHFLPKPFSLKQLAVAVKETLGR